MSATGVSDTVPVRTDGGKPFVGPRSIPLLGWRARGLEMLRDPAKFFMGLYRRYGEVVAWDPRRPSQLFVAGEYCRMLFSRPSTFIVDGFRPVKLPRDSAIARMSVNLLSLNGDRHANHRRLMQPAFLGRNFETHVRAIVECTHTALERWQYGATANIDAALSPLIVAIATRTMFGIDDVKEHDRIAGLIATLLSATSSPLTMILPFNVPGSPYRRMLQASEKIEAVIRDVIRERRRQPGDRNDVLSVLIASSDRDPDGLSDTELIGELYTVLCHETVVSALLWTLLLLDQHPRVADDVEDEVKSVLRGAPPTVENLDRMVLLDAVLKESLRLFPPVVFGNRYAAEDCDLSEYRVNKDAVIFFSSYVNHRLPDTFDRPARFDPARWASGMPVARHAVYAPFGIGAHSCIAMYFAMAEMKIILAMMFQRFRLRLPGPTKVNRGMRFSLVPNPELVMRIDRCGATAPRADVYGNIRESVELD